MLGSGQATMSDSSMRAKPSIDEPSKPMPFLEGAFELGRRHREALEEAQHVGEPEAHELDLLVLHDAKDIFLGHLFPHQLLLSR